MVLEPQDLVGEGLFCCVFDFWNGEVASDSKTVRNVGEEVELVVNLVLLEDLLGLIPQLSREDAVLFCARKDQWLADGFQLLVADKRRVCEGADVQQPLRSQVRCQILGAEAVANTGQED